MVIQVADISLFCFGSGLRKLVFYICLVGKKCRTPYSDLEPLRCILVRLAGGDKVKVGIRFGKSNRCLFIVLPEGK